jgi:hypothetical protein
MRPAFRFDIVDGSRWCSRLGVKCIYNDGTFAFNGVDVSFSDKNSGGIGGFIGPKHEYFVYCGSKFPDIAIAKYNNRKDLWESYAFQSWHDVHEDGGYFKQIWIARDGLALIFQPQTKFRRDLLQELTGDEKLEAIRCDLLTRGLTGITKGQFVQQRHSKIDHDSRWPAQFDDKGSDSTLCDQSETPFYTKAEVTQMMDQVGVFVSTYLDEIEKELKTLFDRLVR